MEKQLQMVQREMRLTQLRRQVTPHFLFNSLSVAMSLVVQTPKVAIKFLRHLAQMYRYLQQYGNEYSVPIEKEMEMLRQYYELMSLRHVKCIRLQVSKQVKELKGNPLPPLSLQGLLENAIKHNVHTPEQPLTVKMTTEEGYLVISNKIKPLVSDPNSTNMGLAYMNETTQLLFNKSIIVVNDGDTFTVKLPLI